MNICKFYVNGKCNNNNCTYEHMNNICRNYFFGKCTRNNCKFSHEYKLNNNNSNNNNNNNKDNVRDTKIAKNSQNSKRGKIKNTETFEPSHNEPSIRLRLNEPIYNGNEVSIVDNIFYEKDIYNNLLKEITNDVYKPWHGDSHLIADDNSNIDWKSNSELFQNIIKKLCSYFCMTPSATRLNYYTDSKDWKPYHHDAAALKENKARTQNITVGASFGLTREISFESTHRNKEDRLTFNLTLKDSTVYSFGNKVNIDFRHGIPQLKEESNYGRISIIIWGFSSLIH